MKKIKWAKLHKLTDAPMMPGEAVKHFLKVYHNCIDAGYDDKGHIFAYFNIHGNKQIVEFIDEGTHLKTVNKKVALSSYA